MALKKKTKDLLPPKNKLQYSKIVKKGQSFFRNNDYVQALKYLTTAWKYDATDTNLLIMVANCLFKIGNKTAAMELMGHALQASPNDPVIVSILGNRALEMNFFSLALKFQQKYIELKPDDPLGYNNYATALREDGQYEEAIEFLQSMIPIFPDTYILWNTLGSVVGYRDGYKSALVFFEEALKLEPNNVQILNNIAPAYATNNNLEKSEEIIKKAIVLDPSYPGPHLFLSHLLLSSHRFKEGWEEHEWRHDMKQFQTTVKLNNIPYWNGEDLTGKKIFIFGEQGIGDEILFTWLYPQIIKEAEQVGLGCEERLVPLFKNSFPTAEVSRSKYRINRALDIQFTIYPDIDISEYDYQCIACELTTHKWKEYNDINNSYSPYLKPSTDKIKIWKEKITELPHDISVGISWRSGIQMAKRARNYTALLDWAPILKYPNINFINLQYGDCQDELDEFEVNTGIKIHNFKELDLKDDFENTIALMVNLDICLGPASSPMAQSAMSGVPTWYIMNGQPWWAFGDEFPKWSKNARILSKNDSMPWPEFMEEKAKDFEIWLKETRESK